MSRGVSQLPSSQGESRYTILSWPSNEGASVWWGDDFSYSVKGSKGYVILYTNITTPCSLAIDHIVSIIYEVIDNWYIQQHSY